MGIVEAFAVPHPPILVPGIGRGEEQGAQATVSAYRQVAERIGALAPELLIISSPHAPLYSDAFCVSTGCKTWGDFRDFRFAAGRVDINLDVDFAEVLLSRAKSAGLPVVLQPVKPGSLDHGCMVPLYFIHPHLPTGCRVLRISISFLDAEQHYSFGQCIAQVAQELKRRTVYLASGDLSHKLKETGPYGYDPAGPKFDAAVIEAFASGELERLMHFPADFREQAAECGLSSFIVMAGALDALARPLECSQLLSYEGPWGIGYGVARFVPDGCGEVGTTTASLPVRLAWAALTDHLDGLGPSQTSTQVAALLRGLPKDDATMLQYLQSQQAGAFVSFKKRGELRGCIGTIQATTENIFTEICQNTVSAAAHDPRFQPIQSVEVPELSCSVDILGAAESIDSLGQLDVKRYGVIVSNKGRRGLLLPDLDGVDTPEQQVEIALHKAGISPRQAYRMERFEVRRYE
ncbi:MAG: AmmeMemoRadiSam system protein A [Actinomycetia bacterium]|nr:AmmeMemoRadiSam system protein A [Actinomycetes bacterium]